MSTPGTLSLASLARVLRAAADECDAIASEQTTERLEWIDQRQSPLGPRRHCRAVRARVSASQDGAAIVGRRHLMSPEALADALQNTTSQTSDSSEPDDVADMRAQLSMVRGGQR